jgi:hypothetical protein
MARSTKLKHKLTQRCSECYGLGGVKNEFDCVACKGSGKEMMPLNKPQLLHLKTLCLLMLEGYKLNHTVWGIFLTKWMDGLPDGKRARGVAITSSDFDKLNSAGLITTDEEENSKENPYEDYHDLHYMVVPNLDLKVFEYDYEN